jgi:hypothetical protein
MTSGPLLCEVCGALLNYAGTGRRPTYCSERCRLKAKRRRFRAPKAAAEDVSGTSPELRAALERVRLAEEQLRAAQTAWAALDGPQPDPLDPPHLSHLGGFGLAGRRARAGLQPLPGHDRNGRKH